MLPQRGGTLHLCVTTVPALAAACPPYKCFHVGKGAGHIFGKGLCSHTLPRQGCLFPIRTDPGQSTKAAKEVCEYLAIVVTVRNTSSVRGSSSHTSRYQSDRGHRGYWGGRAGGGVRKKMVMVVHGREERGERERERRERQKREQ